MDMRNYDHRDSGGDRDFIIFTETSGMVEPKERAFNHPVSRKFWFFPISVEQIVILFQFKATFDNMVPSDATYH